MLDRNSYVPLYCQLADELQAKIEAGEILPGDKLPSESEMIQQYNIGRPTVRMALSQLVNKGYLEKVHGRGTYCKASHVNEERLNIDVILDMADTYFIPYYMKSISEVLTENKCNFIVSDSKNSTEEICSLLHKIIEKGTSGVILQPSHLCEEVPQALHDCFRMYRNAGIPYLMIDCVYEGIETSYTILDEYKGGCLAANYLHSLGHRKILTVYIEKFKDSILRLNGFRSVCEEQAVEQPILLPYRKERFAEDLMDILKAQKPTAVFCYNDDVAVECIRILRENGLLVPEDISVLGFDDSVLVGASVPPLTTILHPKQIMGELAARVILELIHKNRPWPYTNLFSPSLVQRDSCLPLSRV